MWEVWVRAVGATAQSPSTQNRRNHPLTAEHSSRQTLGQPEGSVHGICPFTGKQSKPSEQRWEGRGPVITALGSRPLEKRSKWLWVGICCRKHVYK